MKTILTVIILIFGFKVMLAQGLHFGPQIGFASTTIIEKGPVGAIDKSLKMGYQLGAAAEFEIMSFLYVSGSITFFNKGDKIKGEGFKSKTNFGCLDIPINIGYKMPLGNISVFGSIGPYTSVTIMGKSEYIIYDQNGNVEYEHSHPAEIGGEYGYYKRFDTGITVAAGVEFKQYQLKINYARGFTDFTNTDFIKSYNSIINISGAYFFGRNY
jgi:hypothetical protein